MEWWDKIVFPVRRAWFLVSARFRARKNGTGLLKLHDDVQTCGYEDVHIMWDMLRKTDQSQVITSQTKHKRRWFWRTFARATSSSYSQAH